MFSVGRVDSAHCFSVHMARAGSNGVGYDICPKE